jgi:hypothetical protein
MTSTVRSANERAMCDFFVTSVGRVGTTLNLFAIQRPRRLKNATPFFHSVTIVAVHHRVVVLLVGRVILFEVGSFY